MSGPHVQIRCPGCSTYYRTRIRGNTTRCPDCSTPRYVPASQTWEGPDSTRTRMSEQAALSRAPAAVQCPDCGHEWESRAAGGTTIRCPGRLMSGEKCRHPVRVSSKAHRTVAPAPAAVQFDHPPRPRPVPVRPAPAPVSPRPTYVRTIPAVRPVPPARPLPPVAPRPVIARPAPDGTNLGALVGILGGMFGRSTPPAPAPRPPAPARVPVPPAPARSTQPAGRHDGEAMKWNTRPNLAYERLRKLGMQLADPDIWSAGGCWIEPQWGGVCGVPASHRVSFAAGIFVNVCPQHASTASRLAGERDASVNVVLRD